MILNSKTTLGKHTGTTTIAITCKDGVVFGTDRRATEGYYVAHKHVKKVYKIVDHIAMTTAGVVADAQQLVDIMSAECNLYALNHGIPNPKPIPVAAAAQLFSNILFERRWFPYYAQSLIGGFDKSGARVFSLDPVGSLIEETTVTATGSGTTFAIAVLEDGYKPDMIIKDAITLAIYAVRTAIERDIGSGNGIDIVYIDKNGYHEVPEKEILEELKQSNREITTST
ncbi:MAG: archaeal proteasome endopeptidase complex subunit beta [Candidatus Helarchaeota archaeon]